MKGLINKLKEIGRKSLIYAALPLALSGCYKDEFPDDFKKKDKEEEIIENPNEEYGKVYVLNEEDLKNISVKEDDSGTIYFGRSQAYIEEGDILAAGISEETPQGLLRKVTNVVSLKEVKTTQATLEEAIEEGFTEGAFSFSQEDIEITTMGRRSRDSGYGFSLDYEEVIYDLDNNLETKNDQVRVKGSLDFDLGSYARVMIKGHKLKRADLRLQLEGRVNLELTSDFELNFEKEMKIGEIGLKPVVMMAGIIPVVIKPEIEFYVSAKGELNSKIKSKISDRIYAGCFLEYSKEVWTSGGEFSNDFGFKVNTEASAEVKASTGPKLSLDLYGIAGPSMRTDAYLELKADINKNPWWELYGGLETKLGFNAEVLGKSIADYEEIISDERKKIADAGGPFKKELTAYFEVTPETGDTDTEFRFDASKSPGLSGETVAINYRWDWDSDGVYDTDYSLNPIEQKSFSHPGSRNIILEVLNSRGERDTFSKELFVDMGSGGGDFETGILYDERDGQEYNTIKIGDQWWMGENLNYDIEGSSLYNEDPFYENIYGRLYNWESSKEGCPSGWYLPEKENWTELFDYFGGRNVQGTGGKVKSTGTLEEGTGLWHSPNYGATNESGFTALPGGRAEKTNNQNITYDHEGYEGYFWVDFEGGALAYSFSHNTHNINEVSYGPGIKHIPRFSVRCIKED